MNPHRILFVFRHADGRIRAEYINGVKSVDNKKWEHVATIDPKLWMEAHYARIDALTEASNVPDR